MFPQKDISSPDDSNRSRRRFLGNGIKLSALSALLLPLQKAFGNGSAYFLNHLQLLGHSLCNNDFGNKLILNAKTNVVHLHSEKIFHHIQDIAAKNQMIIDLRTWETQVKYPVHFNIEKSGIILELLALQKLAAGINDKSMAAATNTLAIAFAPAYNTSNKYNFRVHDLLMQTIALNFSIPSEQKWKEFQSATAGINYSKEFRLPKRMKWLKTQIEFNDQVNYILKNRTKFTDRLKLRVAEYKL